MSFLLDSNAFLWWIKGQRFERGARRRVERAGATVSAATVWELGIKASAGKLRFDRPITDEVDQHEFVRLGITFEHAERATRLPRHHGDPFDRMLIAQAQIERLTIVTRDGIFDEYDVEVLHC